jgi:hypothetical protein
LIFNTGEGDVNAISRVHTFLETLGAINVGVVGGRKAYDTTLKDTHDYSPVKKKKRNRPSNFKEYCKK